MQAELPLSVVLCRAAEFRELLAKAVAVGGANLRGDVRLPALIGLDLHREAVREGVLAGGELPDGARPHMLGLKGRELGVEIGIVLPVVAMPESSRTPNPGAPSTTITRCSTLGCPRSTRSRSATPW